VKFTANWCGNCQYLERTVYSDQAVIEALAHHLVVPLKADVTHNGAIGWELLRQLRPGGGIPLTAIYRPEPAAASSR
jgi:thiol:disulfide interchange protein